MSSSGQMHTGHPGPGMISICGGNAARKPCRADRAFMTATDVEDLHRPRQRQRADPLEPLRRTDRGACHACCPARRECWTRRAAPQSGLVAQPVEPRRETRARAGGEREHRGRIAELAQLSLDLRRVEIVHDPQQVALGHEHEVGVTEHDGVLGRLVVTFSDRQEHDVTMRTEREAGRAHEVPDVLDEYQRQRVELQLVQRVVHHVRVQMAGRPGRDLNRGNSVAADPGRVVVGLEVAFDHGAPELLSQRAHGRLEQQRLAGAGRRHQVHRQHAVSIEVLTVVLGFDIVALEQWPHEGQVLWQGHRAAAVLAHD